MTDLQRIKVIEDKLGIKFENFVFSNYKKFQKKDGSIELSDLPSVYYQLGRVKNNASEVEALMLEEDPKNTYYLYSKADYTRDLEELEKSGANKPEDEEYAAKKKEIHHRYITKLEFNTKFRIKNVLRTLRISNVHELKEVPIEVFQFPDLHSLLLNNNGITTIPELTEDTNLRAIDFSDNNLETLPQSLFENIGKVDIIDMSNNNLKALPELKRRVRIDKAKNIQSLDFSNNQLTSVPESFIKFCGKLTEYDLTNNNFTEEPEFHTA